MISVQEVSIRLVLALVLGALVGLERERGERTAGLRTHALVSLGACLVMIVSAFGFSDVMGIRNISLDPSRIAAQVVSGIGFLGAGTILLRKEIVKGLTTAAAIWVVAAIGLACGAGLWLDAAIATLFTIATLTLLRPLRHHVRRAPEMHNLRIKLTAVDENLLNRSYDICLQMGVTITTLEMQTGGGKEKLEMECTTNDVPRLSQALTTLRNAEGIETLSIMVRNPTNSGTPFPLFELDAQPVMKNAR